MIHSSFEPAPSYALPMKFRTKFGALGWFSVSLACLYGYTVLLTGKSRLDPGNLCRCLVSPGPRFGSSPTSSHTGKRTLPVCAATRFFATRHIAWDDIKHVGGFNGREASAAMWTVDDSREAPMSDRGQIMANPADRLEFIAALRKFAPQADFEVLVRCTSPYRFHVTCRVCACPGKVTPRGFFPGESPSEAPLHRNHPASPEGRFHVFLACSRPCQSGYRLHAARKPRLSAARRSSAPRRTSRASRSTRRSTSSPSKIRKASGPRRPESCTGSSPGTRFWSGICPGPSGLWAAR